MGELLTLWVATALSTCLISMCGRACLVDAWIPTQQASLRANKQTSCFDARPRALINSLTSATSIKTSPTSLSYKFGDNEDISRNYYLVIERLSTTWDKWSRGIWQRTNNFSGVEANVQQAAAHIESIITEASIRAAASTESIQALVLDSTHNLEALDLDNTTTRTFQSTTKLQNQKRLKSTETIRSTDLLGTAAKIALRQGLNITEAADVVRETKSFATTVLSVADSVLRNGYIRGDPFVEKEAEEYGNFLQDFPTVQGSKALFSDFSTAYELNTYTPELMKAAEMGCLSGAIYEDTIPRTHTLEQTMVARGMTEDVSWMITDSISDQSSFAVMKNNAATPFVVRTITIRGYDASDVAVDRVRLLNRIANASPERIRPATLPSRTIVAHSGLLEIARAIYKDVKPFIEWTAPHHKIVLNGHSVGGSISLLILFLMTQEKGADFTKKKIIKVYTFGSPPIVCMESKPSARRTKDGCEILEAFDLPSSLVSAHVQPWDPIIRQFSEIDSLYPLIEDIGEDGITLWVNGPPRALRSITKAIFEAWNGWPCFRDTAKENSSQAYIAVGIQHLMLPDPTRYLADRFLAVNIAAPPVATILRISPSELYRALETVFPLDVFEVSYIPQAIRSFVHHFYPAYGLPIMDYVKELQRQSQDFPERNS